ncbi:hypothetical protein [Alteromonas sp. H39]|uniref:hypothetical protein n=1 Tax=Alteromonas sp. H39 TaxID=3389876 RepID=UPI0039DF4E13
MQSREQLLSRHLPISRLSIDVLLALRLYYDSAEEGVSLDKDIAELSEFPERLSGSYRAEWESVVKREVARQLLHEDTRPVSDLIEIIMAELESLYHHDRRFLHLLGIVKQAEAIEKTDNARVFPTPLRRQLMALLLPAITLPPKPVKSR